ncbi:MAG: FeoA domain-containing protein [Steroidobacteraceae bacterium]
MLDAPPMPLALSVSADIPLAELAPGASARVVSVSGADSKAPAEVSRRLAELGFLLRTL